MKSVLQIIILSVLLHVGYTWASPRMEKEKEILQSILRPGSYNPDIRPSDNSSGPVRVDINMYIRNIVNIDDINMDYSVQVTFRQSWRDGRLTFPIQSGVKYLSLRSQEKIWTPDPFFSNELTGQFHNIVKPNVLARIYPDGKVLYSIRLSLKLSCPMDLRRYPMDRQVCSLLLASYAYTTEDIIFYWKEDNPVQITRNLNLPHFSLEKFYTDYCPSKTNTGEYSCIKLDFLFRRELNYYLSEVFFPSIILVIISWITFWLDPKATTARVFIWMTTILGFSMKLLCFSSKVPSVDYNKAYDTWTKTCLSFLIAVIFEIGVVAYFYSREMNEKASEDSTECDDHVKKTDFNEEKPQKLSNAVVRVCYRLRRRFPSSTQRIDVICRCLFPVAFALFNLIFWCSNAQDHD